ncbi:MAG: hypothetical protein HWD59_09635 [Coxiellaceae bacterium]|nr:MAG: hypothetical protein HWD59_09635 [Coxiellaceae bacterium]
MPPAVVQVVTAQPAEWQQKLSITGSLTALQGIMLKPEIAGRITEIYFQPGQFVQKAHRSWQ